MVFSDNCGHSSLETQLNLTNNSFLKVSYNVESETKSINFSCFAALKLIGPSCTLQRSLL